MRFKDLTNLREILRGLAGGPSSTRFHKGSAKGSARVSRGGALRQGSTVPKNAFAMLSGMHLNDVSRVAS